MKFATFIKAAEGETEAGQTWIKSTYLPQIRAAAPNLRGCVYRLCRPSPDTYFDAFADRVNPAFGRFDVLLETWFSSAEDFRREMIPLESQLTEHGMTYDSYHVVPRLILDPRITEAGAGGVRPEITSICTNRWKRDVPKEEASRRYLGHAAFALRNQKAITKYEQNIVEERISWSEGVLPMDAYADFSHPTVETCRTGLAASLEETQDSIGYTHTGRFSYLGDAQPLPS